MPLPLLCVFFLILGCALGWMLKALLMRNSWQARLEKETQGRIIAETKLSESLKNFEEQKAILAESQSRFQTIFKAISGEALKSNNQAFLDLAKEALEGLLKEAKGDIGEKTGALKNLVLPLEEALGRYERELGELEKSRASAHGSLEAQIQSLIASQDILKKETGSLVNALRRPEISGRWGEITLRRVVELAGMTEHCDYTEQLQVRDAGDNVLRPDMIIHLPAKREIVVDSKVSMVSYLEAVGADSDEKRKEALQRHAQQVRRHMRELAGKSYWSQFSQAPEFVVMFLPGESFLNAAAEADPSLLEDGMKDSIILATPTTLMALLRAIAYGWRQEQVTKHAQEIADLAKDLYRRFEPFIAHINTTSGHLAKTVLAFNKMVMSLERRVLVGIRKFKDLGVVGEDDLPELEPVEPLPLANQEEEISLKIVK